jgi:hypothetical protein
MSSDIEILRETVQYHQDQKERYCTNYLMYEVRIAELNQHASDVLTEDIGDLLRIVNRKYMYNLHMHDYHLKARVFWTNVLLFERGDMVGYEINPAFPMRPSRHDFA